MDLIFPTLVFLLTVYQIGFCKPSAESNCRNYPPMTKDGIEFNELAGIWYGMKAGPPNPGFEDTTCWYDIYSKDPDAPENKFNSLFGFSRGTIKGFVQFSVSSKLRSENSKEMEPVMNFEGLVDFRSTLIGSDRGKSWLAWNYCSTIPPMDSFVIMTRYPILDSETEANIMNYILKNLTNLTSDQFKTIAQTNCY